MQTRAERMMKYIKGPMVLDVGCAGHVPDQHSPYWLHGQLRKHFPNVIGIDINEANVAKLKSFGLDNVFVASAESFSYEKKFDTIVAGELIEHVSNPGQFLRLASEHLAPQGRIVLSTPYPFTLLFILYAFFKFPKTCENLEHTCWFCIQTMHELCRREGLKITHWELIDDYKYDEPSLKYRFVISAITYLRWFIPKRLRCNTMVFTIERA